MTAARDAGQVHTLGLLHPGRMGTAVAAQARRNGIDVLWCPLDRGTATADRARRAGLTPVASLAELAQESQVVISLCPPAAAEDVADAVAAQAFTGLYLEANAIGPDRYHAIADTLTQAGATVLDGAVFGPPPSDTVTTRLNLAGPAPAAATIAGLFTGTGVQVVTMTQPAPAASALKIAYSSYQKATRALAAVAHALAADYGVTEELVAAGRNNDTSPLTDPDYLPGVAARAWRWAPELRDAAAALRHAGLPPDLADAAAAVLDQWAEHKDQWDTTLTEALNALRSTQP
jgi:3-hydroxyisobutyrate dehydrogenase-like beta-hydroxyacid dehydrogenase